MVKRRNSLNDIDFIRGKYDINNIEQISKLFRLMTKSEIEKIKSEEFDTLWVDLWQETSRNKIYQKEYIKMIDTIIGIAVVGFAGYLVYKMMFKKETIEEAVKETIAEAKAEVTKVADVNKDGKVDVADAVEVVKTVKAAAKKRGPKKKAK